MWYVRDVLYAVFYVRVRCFVLRGCGVSRRYIDVCYCDMFSGVNVYLDHLKFCVVCVHSQRYVCCSECDVSNECNEPTSCSIMRFLNPVAPYGYLLSDMYWFMADITNPDWFVQSCRTWIGLDITRFCEQQRQPSSGSAWPAFPTNGKLGPHCWGLVSSTQFAQQLESAVTAPPLVCCVVWSPSDSFMISITKLIEIPVIVN